MVKLQDILPLIHPDSVQIIVCNPAEVLLDINPIDMFLLYHGFALKDIRDELLDMRVLRISGGTRSEFKIYVTTEGE